MAFVAALVPALSILSAVSAVGGGVASYVGAKSQAKYEQDAYGQQAAFQTALGERNAKLVDIEGAAAADALARDRARRLGAFRARVGASGGTFSGSPLDAYADEAGQYSRDASYLRFNTAVRRQDAVLGGQVATRRELLGQTAAQVQGNNAYGSILGGFGQAAGSLAQADWSFLS
jgi:hypothetical protein